MANDMANDAACSYSLFQRVWPRALLILGVGITAVWAVVLGYGFIALIGMAL